MVDQGIVGAASGGVVLELARAIRERRQRGRCRRGRDAALSGTLQGPGIPKYSLNTKVVIAAHTLTGVEQIFGGGGARYEVARSDIRNIRFDAPRPPDRDGRMLFTKAVTFETDAGRFTLIYDPLWDRLLHAALPSSR